MKLKLKKKKQTEETSPPSVEELKKNLRLGVERRDRVRQDHLTSIKKAISTGEGEKIKTKKHIWPAIKAMYPLLKRLSREMTLMMEDTINMVDHVSTMRHQVHMMSMFVAAVTEQLEEKGLVTSEELGKSFDEKVREAGRELGLPTNGEDEQDDEEGNDENKVVEPSTSQEPAPADQCQ